MINYTYLTRFTFLLLIFTVFLTACGGGDNNQSSQTLISNSVDSVSASDFLDTYVPLRKYYVDYSGGDDLQLGTSTGTAWKHAPGDPNAIGNAKITLQSGDMVLFKGGVSYKGTIIINANGASTDPIIYKGNGWGVERAVIDGSESLSNWIQCASAADCGGNSNWVNIYHTAAPAGTTALTSNLYQGNEMLFVSQHPNPTDPFFMDNHDNYKLVSGLTSTTATDSWFVNIGGDELIGSYAFVWRSSNEVDFRKITAFSLANNRITFNALGASPYTQTDRFKLAIANNINDSVLDKAGEYYFDESSREVYLWPLGSIDPDTSEITISVRSTSFNIGSYSNIAIEGFRIQKGIGTAIKTNYAKVSGITIKNNEVIKWRNETYNDLISIRDVTSALIKDNYLALNARLRGFQVSGDNIIIQNNRLIKLGRTPIGYMGGNHGKIIDNYIEASTGVHSNGISIYLGATDILVARNKVFNSNIPITFQDAHDLRIINNIFHGNGKDTSMACWAGSSSTVSIKHNNLLSGNSWGGGFYNQQGVINGLEIKNNIIDGMDAMQGDISNNIYTRDFNKPLGTGEVIVTDINSIFLDASNHQYQLLPTSPAIDMGTTVNVLDDITRKKRPAGTAPDIGAYEYSL